MTIIKGIRSVFIVVNPYCATTIKEKSTRLEGEVMSRKDSSPGVASHLHILEGIKPKLIPLDCFREKRRQNCF